MRLILLDIGTTAHSVGVWVAVALALIWSSAIVAGFLAFDKPNGIEDIIKGEFNAYFVTVFHQVSFQEQKNTLVGGPVLLLISYVTWVQTLPAAYTCLLLMYIIATELAVLWAFDRFQVEHLNA